MSWVLQRAAERDAPGDALAAADALSAADAEGDARSAGQPELPVTVKV